MEAIVARHIWQLGRRIRALSNVFHSFASTLDMAPAQRVNGTNKRETQASSRSSSTTTISATSTAPAKVTTKVTKKTKPASKARVLLRACDVCAEDLPPPMFPSRVHPGFARSTHAACFVCWEHYVSTKLDSLAQSKGIAIACLCCSTALRPEDIRKVTRYADDDLYNRFLDASALAAARADPNWVSCPRGACTSGAILRDGYIFTCPDPSCRARYCVSCAVPMHEGLTCSEYAAREAEKELHEQLSHKEVQRQSKPCPECGARLRKIGGCDHFTCGVRGCRHEFCWPCGAPYRGKRGILEVGNQAHRATCKYFAAPHGAYPH